MDQVGRFRITKELGRGAMGVVYQAVDPTIGRAVAIKTIRLREVDDSDQRNRLRERLFREARSAGVLSHPNIVTIYDMDEEDGTAFITMQFVNGPTVETLLEKQKTLDPEQIFRILRQTASALDFAHSKGIVHRDIKPANIMIDEDGTVKIADFGIAKASASGNLTASGTILGTPNYMSPEQVQGTAINGRSDQFSLGVVAYEILTGERPFSGENIGTVVYRIVAEPAAEPVRINPALGEEISKTIQKALQKNAKRRYLSCTEFVTSLIAACEATPGWHALARSHAPIEGTSTPTAAPKRARRKTTTSAAVLSPPLLEDTPAAKPATQQRKTTSTLLPATAAFVVVLGVLALVAWQTGSPAEPKMRTPEIIGTAAVEDVEQPPADAAKPEAVKTESSESDTKRDPLSQGGTSPSSPNPLVTGEKPEASKPDSVRSLTAKPAFAKRSPFGPSASPVGTIPQSPAQSPQPNAGAAPSLQDVSVVTQPPGVLATLDNDNQNSCQTPCMLLSAPGVHLLSLTMKDYQVERRQIRVGDAREEVPLVVMRPIGATLFISTIPSGANIFLNDQMLAEMTPAQIALQPGRYNIAVERDGTRKTQQVVLKNGATNYLRIPMTN